MYSSSPMTECFGYIRLPNEQEFKWVKGFTLTPVEVGIDKASGMYVFFVEGNVRQRFYLTEEQISYEDGA